MERGILEVSGHQRQSIGRDLHDDLGQELTGVALMLRGLAAQVGQRCPDALGSVNEIVGLVNQSIENVRSLPRGLLPVRHETGGLASALRDLAYQRGPARHAILVEINLGVAGNTFTLSIRHDGEGFRAPMSPYSGMGLKIMQYRAGMIGAKLRLPPTRHAVPWCASPGNNH